MRGYFAIGVEGLSKPMNFGNLLRSAHGFGASFFFTINADTAVRNIRSDTSNTVDHLPYYAWEGIEDMALPRNCQLVGVELTDDAVELPSFGHPVLAAYVMGAERSSLTPPLQARCDHIIKIPTAFCINVATAGAIVMYDRIRSMGKFAERPVATGAPTQVRPQHVQGKPVFRSDRRASIFETE